MRAYYHDDLPGDQRLPHVANPSSSPVPEPHLASLGLLHRSLRPAHSPSSAAELDRLARDRGYAHRDQIVVSREAMGSEYETKIRGFFEEHMHEDEEIRFILEGAGYFDVRERGDDRWVRVRVEEGDLLVLPAGVYHRFTVDEGNYIKAMRLFRDEPKWTPLNRGQDTEENRVRKEYLLAREKGFQEVGEQAPV